MKAAAFDYVRADDLAHCFALMRQHGDAAKLVAGGQSLIPALNMRLMTPGILIDITPIAALRGIEIVGTNLRLGALTRHVELERSPVVAKHAPLLAMAMAHVAHPAIRNRGTLGGNLAYADPASELPACLLALKATIIATGASAERRIAADSFFTGLFATALGADEVLTAVEVPLGSTTAEAQDRVSFEELARRRGDYAIVGLACHAKVAGDRFQNLELAYFAVGERPTLAKSAAGALIRTHLSQAAVGAAQTALAQDLDPHHDPNATPAMRLHLARVLLARAVARLSQPSSAGQKLQ